MSTDNVYGTLKSRLLILLICFLISCCTIIATTPLHETAHWIMSEIDPYIEPVEIHFFDYEFSRSGQNILTSPLGYVTVKESYPGSFNDRPIWADSLQEVICIFIQIIIVVLVILKILPILLKKEDLNMLKE